MTKDVCNSGMNRRQATGESSRPGCFVALQAVNVGSPTEATQVHEITVNPNANRSGGE